MLSREQLHDYQIEATNHMLAHPQSMLWLDMGLGKTIVSLTALVERIDYLQVYGTLIIAPLRVCQTVWAQEAAKWNHTRHLRFHLVHGAPDAREVAMRNRADVWLVNYENIQWLVTMLETYFLGRGIHLPFNNVIFDEISKMKDTDSKRFKAFKRLLPYIPYRTGLTGTPASNGYVDLCGQYLCIDDGLRLGRTVTSFRETFCRQRKDAPSSYELREGLEQYVEAAVADITLSMNRRDYLDLPDVHINDIYVDLPGESMAKYKELEKTMFIELDSGVEIEVFNAAALCNKCLQAANGAMYVEPGEPYWDILHDAKLDALQDVVEEAGGQPILLCYEFQHDRDRIMKRFPKAETFRSGMTADDVQVLIRRWNAGEVSMLVGHPQSMGHGLNLQYGGHILVWYGLNWSLDLYLQAIARLDRQGQTHPVIIHRLLSRNTLDEGVAERLASKDQTQAGLRKAIENYRGKTYTKGELLQQEAVADALKIMFS
jgi:SNF2 family DNA or RNA helicase